MDDALVDSFPRGGRWELSEDGQRVTINLDAGSHLIAAFGPIALIASAVGIFIVEPDASSGHVAGVFGILGLFAPLYLMATVRLKRIVIEDRTLTLEYTNYGVTWRKRKRPEDLRRLSLNKQRLRTGGFLCYLDIDGERGMLPSWTPEEVEALVAAIGAWRDRHGVPEDKDWRLHPSVRAVLQYALGAALIGALAWIFQDQLPGAARRRVYEADRRRELAEQAARESAERLNARRDEERPAPVPEVDGLKEAAGEVESSPLTDALRLILLASQPEIDAEAASLLARCAAPEQPAELRVRSLKVARRLPGLDPELFDLAKQAAASEDTALRAAARELIELWEGF